MIASTWGARYVNYIWPACSWTITGNIYGQHLFLSCDHWDSEIFLCCRLLRIRGWHEPMNMMGRRQWVARTIAWSLMILQVNEILFLFWSAYCISWTACKLYWEVSLLTLALRESCNSVLILFEFVLCVQHFIYWEAEAVPVPEQP